MSKIATNNWYCNGLTKQPSSWVANVVGQQQLRTVQLVTGWRTKLVESRRADFARYIIFVDARLQ